MRIALISDIHANEVALKAVIDDIHASGVDQIHCLGDVANLGSSPVAVIRILQDLNCPCIMGNHDAFLIDPDLIRSYSPPPIIVDALDWCRSQLTEKELAFIRTFAPTREIRMDGEATLFLYHGSPRSHMEDILSTTPPEELDRMLGGKYATVMAGGHTHIQMLRQHRGTLIVNPGSVGVPFQEYVGGQTPTLLGHAEYAIIESTPTSLRVDLRRIPLDKKALRMAAQKSEDPLREWFLQQYA